MSARASTAIDLRPGQPFIPRMMFYGSVIPDSVMSLKTLKEGPKLLLARLYKFAGDKDVCNPSLRTLAAELGTSEDKIGRWLKALEQHCFIRTVRHARKEAERLLLWHQDLSASRRTPGIGNDNADSAKLRNHNLNDSAELRIHAPMIPQNRSDDSAKSRFPIRKKRIIEENHHQSENSVLVSESPVLKRIDDDDSFKVRTLLREFFASRGLRIPRGTDPVALMVSALARQGREHTAGTAEFLQWYGANLREPPVSWNHVVASFERWIGMATRDNTLVTRKGPQSQANPSGQTSRYPLVSIPDPFAVAVEAVAI